MAGKVVTDDQVVEAYQEHGSYRAAARALGLSHDKVRIRMHRMALRAKGAPPPEGFAVRRITQRGDGTVTSVHSAPVDDEPREAIPEGHEVRGVSTLLSADGSVAAQWVKTRVAEVSHQDMRAAIDSHMAAYRGAWTPIEPPSCGNDQRMNMFVWGDPHIGLLSHARETGTNFDLKISVHDLRRSAELLVAKAPVASTAVFLETGDLWHAETDKQITPRGGNKLDVDGRKTKILEEGLGCTRAMIDMLRAKHEQVVVVIVPGNHDPDQSIHTRLWLSAVYEGCDAVHVLDNANPYIYHEWGSNFFLFTHGDKRIKPNELGEIMLRDRPEQVGNAKHRRAFTGHVHHKNVAEFRTFRWESFNSLCASDYWHHSEGYRSERLVECITFHTRYGEDSRCRVTHQELYDAE